MDNDKDLFKIYDESFDLDRDGELNASELAYMFDEFEKASSSTYSENDESYLLDDEEDEEFDEDEENNWDDEDEESWDDSDEDDWDEESDDY